MATYAVSLLSLRAQMSVLDKVAQEKMGVFSSPHVAHHEDWAAPKQAAAPTEAESKEQWAKQIEEAQSAGPRYAKRNGNFYEGVVSGFKPSEYQGEAGTASARYGDKAVDPAALREAPFAWSDDSGTVKTQELQRQPDDAKETWAKNIEDAQSGPYFAKPHMMDGHAGGARGGGEPAASTSRKKSDVEASRNILADGSAPSPAAKGRAGATNGATGQWAHTRVVKPAPYLASDPQWQDKEPMTSEMRHMGRKDAMSNADYQKMLEEAQPVHRFAKKSGDFHLKKDQGSPGMKAEPPEPKPRRASRARLDQLATPKIGQPTTTPRQRAQAKVAEATAAKEDDAAAYGQWKKGGRGRKATAAVATSPEEPVAPAAEPTERSESPTRPEALAPEAEQPTPAPEPAPDRKHTIGVDTTADGELNTFDPSQNAHVKMGADVSKPEPEAPQPVAEKGLGVDTTKDGRSNTFDPSQNAEVLAEEFEFERVGGRGGDKQTHAGAKVFSSNWGFGADHGDQNVSDAERFTSHSRAQMAKGIADTQAPRGGRKGKAAPKEAWGEPAPEQPRRKVHQPKYPVEDGTPWGVSHTRADMQKVRDAAAAYEPPAAVRSLPVFSV